MNIWSKAKKNLNSLSSSEKYILIDIDMPLIHNMFINKNNKHIDINIKIIKIIQKYKNNKNV